MNKVILMGRLTRDIELKTSQSGNAFARSAIAVDRPFKKEETDFFNLVAFGKTAEFLNRYFEKGRRILVEGRLQTSNYEDKDGNKRTSTEVVIEQIEFADDKKKSQTNSGTPDFDYPEF